MNDKLDSKKVAYFLPNIFTALNMACGFASILISAKGHFYIAAILILIGGIFDLVDGRIARLTGTESHFGEQFDSMSDLISFGAAPAMLLYYYSLVDFGRPGQVVTFIFLLCGALRLARFNASIEKVSSEFFQGLPIPGAAAALTGLVLFTMEYKHLADIKFLFPVYVIFYSFLMISNIPFNSFKNSTWVKKHKRATLFFIFLLLALLLTYEEIMIFIYITVYVLGSIFYFFLHKGELKNVFEWKGDHDDHEA